jgi:hypothetical protein
VGAPVCPAGFAELALRPWEFAPSSRGPRPGLRPDRVAPWVWKGYIGGLAPDGSCMAGNPAPGGGIACVTNPSIECYSITGS